MKDPNDPSHNGRSYKVGPGSHKASGKRAVAKANRRRAKAACRREV